MYEYAQLCFHQMAYLDYVRWQQADVHEGVLWYNGKNSPQLHVAQWIKEMGLMFLESVLPFHMPNGVIRSFWGVCCKDVARWHTIYQTQTVTSGVHLCQLPLLVNSYCLKNVFFTSLAHRRQSYKHIWEGKNW